jgi:recombinational DNA repair ATPase RecF
MIRLEGLTICEFRGIRRLTISLNGSNFAVCGPNGTGKSGIVDAIEFGLTGNISRLSGKGTGGISVKDHAPHVDSRNNPDRARVIMQITIPTIQKTVSIERTVKDPFNPTIRPNDPDVLAVLAQVAVHPEVVLSRRELIRYVISTPGDRAKEVQALLQLNEVETLRTVLQKIANSCQREINPLKREREQAKEQLLRALGLPTLNSEKLLQAVNERRNILALGPIEVLTPTTSLRDGLVSANTAVAPPRIAKAQAIADVQYLREKLSDIQSTPIAALFAVASTELSGLIADSALLQNISREKFLQTALGLIDADGCPVCDTPWEPLDLKKHISDKIKRFDEASRKRAIAEKKVEPAIAIFTDLSAALEKVELYGQLLKPKIDISTIRDLRITLGTRLKSLLAFLPLSESISALEKLSFTPGILATVTSIETGIASIPEPTKQDAARDYLTVCHERLEAYRGIALRLKQAEERASLTKTISDTYGKISTGVLNGIYKEVEKEFSELYRFINKDDESGFSALLTPDTGKLGFEVDFYGRGYFPPGAYHSEGHQDGMGICLYLALMRYQFGKSFTIAVLDDVLMSVDAGHRREVCRLLKERFPDTQFILTTHDPIWLKHMRTVGLVSSKATMAFRTWNVDRGPTEWEDRDVWEEIRDLAKKNEIRASAALLRHYLEYISGEICHYTRAPVEFRGDAQFQLGDLLPAAIGRFKKLLKEGKQAADSWGKTNESAAISEREKEFTALVAQSQVENWQINPAVHYNEWENLQTADFLPVIDSFYQLIQGFVCLNPKCGGIFYLLPERGPREELRCSCGGLVINLRKRQQQSKAEAA